MARVFLTDEQVELEIERLNASPLVALARKEERVRNRRRQYMYKLRDLEKKGAELAKAGITLYVLDAMDTDEYQTPEKQTSVFTPEQKAAVYKALDDPQKRATICKMLGIKEG